MFLYHENFKILYIGSKKWSNIRKALSEENNINLNIHTIDRILNIFRKIITHYLKDYYKFNKLGKLREGSNISMDESMFIHINGEKIWVIGAKNNKTGNI